MTSFAIMLALALGVLFGNAAREWARAWRERRR